MVNFLPKVVLRVDDPSGPVVETSHHTSFHVGRMMTRSGDTGPFIFKLFSELKLVTANLLFKYDIYSHSKLVSRNQSGTGMFSK